MTFNSGWLKRQGEAVIEEVKGWSETKREVLLKESTNDEQYETKACCLSENQNS